MQTLYSVESLKMKSTNDAVGTLSTGDLYQYSKRSLVEQLDQTTALFAYFAYTVCQIALYAEKDAKIRSERYLRTRDDLSVNTKIAGNDVVWSILENPKFKHVVDEAHLASKIDDDWIKDLYKLLVATDDYKDYIGNRERTPLEEKHIFKFIWTQIVLGHEAFNDFITEDWSNWDDDYELNLILLDHLLKHPKSFNFQQLSSQDKTNFAQELLEEVLTKDDILKTILEPRLKNWDPERVATIDSILLRMGISEFLFFDSIPTKVTINEYIEIGKSYSTPQSGQFINGVLDSTLKDLTQQDKINKIRR